MTTQHTLWVVWFRTQGVPHWLPVQRNGKLSAARTREDAKKIVRGLERFNDARYCIVETVFTAPD